MASLPNVLRRIRRARREEAPPGTQHYEEYEQAYQEAMRELDRLAGETALDELGDWMLAEIRETGRLPTPEAVRKRALTVCEEHDVTVPADSSLRE